jgi:uncharacterized protein (TIGR00369 family)
MVLNKKEEWLLPSRGFVDCFGCAPHNTKGLKLRIWYTKKGCTSYYAIPGEYCGFKGLAHGGIIATLLDEVAAWTIITHLLRFGITLQADVRYLKPVPTGVEIDIKAKILKSDAENVVSLAKIQSKKGTILAEAESRWLLPSSNLLQKITGISVDEIEQLIEKAISPLQQII